MIYQKYSSHPKIRNYCLRWKAKFNTISSRLEKALPDEIEGIVIIPNDLDFESNSKEKHVSKFLNLLFITKNIITGNNIHEVIKKRVNKIKKIVKEENVDLTYSIIHLEELWNKFNDYPKLWSYSFSNGFIVYSTKVIDSLILSIKLKEKILGKFERYVLAVCFSGSVARLTYNDKSDFDIFIVIDDTDVKKMTKNELRERIISVFQGNIEELSKQLRITSNLNFQTYLLTDFWLALKNNNPIIHTLLRDGKPLFDKGIFVAWKQMLQQGILTPTSTASELYKQDSDRRFTIINKKINDLIIEDLFIVLLQYGQAILMVNEIPPTTPHETISILSNENQKFDLNISTIQNMDELFQVRKKYEHGEIKEFTINDLNKYYKKVQKTKNELEVSYKKQKKHSIEIKLKLKINLVNDTLKSITIEIENILNINNSNFHDQFSAFLYSFQLGENSLEMIIDHINNKLKDDKEVYLDFYERALLYIDNKVMQIKNYINNLMPDKKLSLQTKNDDLILKFTDKGISINITKMVISSN